MKTNCFTRIAGIIFGLALLAGITPGIRAQNDAKGGGAKLLELSGQQIAAKPDTASYQPMSCKMCKDEYSTRIDTSARGAHKPAVFVATHLCGGCGTEWSVVGHGKSKVSVATHTCSGCASTGMACCNTKGGIVSTKGMEKIQVAPLK